MIKKIILDDGTELSMKKARKLYEELHEIFGPKETVVFREPYRIRPYVQPAWPYDLWYATSSAESSGSISTDGNTYSLENKPCLTS